jgi:cell wall-associated NlpC family hydrolase
MRFIWLIFVGLAVVIIGFFRPRAASPLDHRSVAPPVAVPAIATPSAVVDSALSPAAHLAASRRDSIIFFALQQLGTNYCYAGTTPATGFDCSGFVQYVFNRFHVPVPHSTALLIDVGKPIARALAQPGDIVVFTGTAKTSTTPGHAGIVVTASAAGPLRFVHSSSAKREPGVKISQVEGTDYERRFMQVRRVL